MTIIYIQRLFGTKHCGWMNGWLTELNTIFPVVTFANRFVELGPDQHDEIKNQIIDIQVIKVTS